MRAAAGEHIAAQGETSPTHQNINANAQILRISPKSFRRLSLARNFRDPD